MTKILLVEDDPLLLTMTRTVLTVNGFEVFACQNGQLALDAFPEIHPDLIISDINMPELNGFDLLDQVRSLPDGAGVPFLFLTGQSERADVNEARRLGADDLLAKPFEPLDLIMAIQSRLERRRQTELFDTRQAHLQTITLLANVIEARDAYTSGHVERVQELALELGRALKWSIADLTILEYGALLHDIGKITIPETILNKPTHLSPEEFEIMMRHTIDGAVIIEGVSHLREARNYILYHHEKWDGTGYPQGLSGLNIPREGRLLAIVDVFDALISERPYHLARSHAEVLSFLRQRAGSHFDPEMVELFCQLQESKPWLGG